MKKQQTYIELYNNVIVDTFQIVYARAYRPLEYNDYLIELILVEGAKIVLKYPNDCRTIWERDFKQIKDMLGIDYEY